MRGWILSEGLDFEVSVHFRYTVSPLTNLRAKNAGTWSWKPSKGLELEWRIGF